MVTPNIRGLTPAQLLRQQELGALRADQVTQEIRRRQAEQREQRQRQMAEADRRQERAELLSQERAILGSPRAREVARIELQRQREARPRAVAPSIDRVQPILGIAPEPPPVRREEVRQLTSAQIAQRVERRELGAGQAQAELQRRVREAPTQTERQRARSALSRVPQIREAAVPVSLRKLAEGTAIREAQAAGAEELAERRRIRKVLKDAKVKVSPDGTFIIPRNPTKSQQDAIISVSDLTRREVVAQGFGEEQQERLLSGRLAGIAAPIAVTGSPSAARGFSISGLQKNIKDANEVTGAEFKRITEELARLQKNPVIPTASIGEAIKYQQDIDNIEHRQTELKHINGLILSGQVNQSEAQKLAKGESLKVDTFLLNRQKQLDRELVEARPEARQKSPYAIGIPGFSGDISNSSPQVQSLERRKYLVDSTVAMVEGGIISNKDATRIIGSIPANVTDADFKKAKESLAADMSGTLRAASLGFTGAPLIAVPLGLGATGATFKQDTGFQRGLNAAADIIGVGGLTAGIATAARIAPATGTLQRVGAIADALGQGEINFYKGLVTRPVETARSGIRQAITSPVDAAVNTTKAQFQRVLPTTDKPGLRLMGLSDNYQTQRLALRERFPADKAAVGTPDGLIQDIVLTAPTRQRASVILDQPEGIMVVRGKGEKVWMLPGGGTEGGSAIRAASKELQEELKVTGVNLKASGDFKGLGDPSDWRGRPIDHAIFEGRLPAGAKPTPSSEIEEIAFWKPGSNLSLSKDTEEILSARAAGRATKGRESLPASPHRGVDVHDAQRAISESTLNVAKTGKSQDVRIKYRDGTLSDFGVKVRPNLLHTTSGRGFAFSGTADGRSALLPGGLVVGEGIEQPLHRLDRKMLWFANQPHGRFITSSSTGQPVTWSTKQLSEFEKLGLNKPIPSIFILSGDDTLSKLEAAGTLNGQSVPISVKGAKPKLHTGAGVLQGESEMVVDQGAKLGKPVQRLTMNDDLGNRVEVFVFGQRLSNNEIANLEISALYGVGRNALKPGIEWTYHGTNKAIAAEVKTLNAGRKAGLDDAATLSEVASKSTKDAALLAELGFIDEAGEVARNAVVANNILPSVKLPGGRAPIKGEKAVLPDISGADSQQLIRRIESDAVVRKSQSEINSAIDQIQKLRVQQKQTPSQIAKISRLENKIEQERNKIDQQIEKISPIRAIEAPPKPPKERIAKITPIETAPGMPRPPRPQVERITRIPSIEGPPPPRPPRERITRIPPVKGPPPPKPPREKHFDLPGDAEKDLKPGEFPRVVTWRQGVTNITVDIDRGIRTFDKAEGTGKGITPDETFKVVTKDRTRPTSKKFDQGVVRLNVTPRSVSFTRRKVT